MQMAYPIAALLVLLPLAIGTWRRWSVHRLLAITALALFVAGGLVLLITTRSVVLSLPRDDAYHDTYYVVAHGHWIANQAVIFMVLFVINWAAYRWARPTGTRVAIVSVWSLTLGLIGPPVLRWTLFTPPQRYIDYEAWGASLFALDQLGIVATGAAALMLLILPIHALIFRRT